MMKPGRSDFMQQSFKGNQLLQAGVQKKEECI